MAVNFRVVTTTRDYIYHEESFIAEDFPQSRSDLFFTSWRSWVPAPPFGMEDGGKTVKEGYYDRKTDRRERR